MWQLILVFGLFVVTVVTVFIYRLIKTNRALAKDLAATDKLLGTFVRVNTGYLEDMASMNRDRDYLLNRNRMLSAQVGDLMAHTIRLEGETANRDLALELVLDELEDVTIAHAKQVLGGTIVPGDN